jgi:hypothetical protein
MSPIYIEGISNVNASRARGATSDARIVAA